MSNYTMPPRRKASDYAKGKISQDEIIALQIANDANIASARKAVKMGEVRQLTPLESASPDELLADDAAQEATARSNLERLGFRPQEAASITTGIRNEAGIDFTSLNANFPAIETDVKSKFNLRLLTPTFFIEYLKQYSQELLASKGVSSGGLASISRNINALINSVAEVRTILPDAAQMNTLLRNVDRIRRSTQQGALLDPIMERIAILQAALPSPVDYDRIDQLNAVAKNQIIQELQTATADLPTKGQIELLIRQVEAGDRNSLRQLEALADSVDSQMKPVLDNILRDVRDVGRTQTEVLREIERSRNAPTSVTKSKQEWDGTYPLDEPEFAVLKALDKKNYLKQAVRRGDLTSVTIGDINEGGFTEARAMSEFENIGSVVGLSAVGKPVGKSSASDTSITSGATPSGVGGLFVSKGGFGFGKKVKVGRGLAVKETPSYREYGKYAIHIPQLEQQDILNVKYKSLGQIPKFKPIPVSDVFRDFIIDLVENGKPNARVYTQICPQERKFFEEMSIGAGVWNGLGLKRTTTSTDEEEAKRFELLKGEYIAGNNNPKVISELRRLVVKMMSDGRIRKNQGVELLMELSI